MSDIGDITGRIALEMGETISQLASFAGKLTEAQTSASGLAGGAAGLSSALQSLATAATGTAQASAQLSDAAQAVVNKQQALESSVGSARNAVQELKQAYDQGAVSAEAVARAEGNLRDALDAALPPLRESSGAMKQFTDAAGSLTQIGAALTATVTVPIVGLGLAALKAAGELEQNKVAFTTMLGSSDAALAHLQQLRDFALATPFQFTELELASKRMMALGFNAAEVIPTLRIIGDAAAGLGMGAAGVERIVTALGQMKAKGAIQAEEMRQLAEAGIPAWNILAKTLNTDVAGAMAAVEKRTVMAAEAIPALLTGINTKFGGMMEAQSKTLLGQWSNLEDAISFTLTDIGTSLAPLAKSMMENLFQPALEAIKSLAHWFGELPEPVRLVAVVIAAAAAAVGPLLVAVGGIGLIIPAVITGFGFLSVAATDAAIFFSLLGMALSEILIPIAAVVAAIALIEFSGVGDDIWKFIAGPVATLKEALALLATDLAEQFKSLGQSTAELFFTAGQLFEDLKPTIASLTEAFNPLIIAVKDVSAAFGAAGVPAVKLSDAMKIGVEGAFPFIGALQGLTTVLDKVKSGMDAARSAIQFLTGDIANSKGATAAAQATLDEFNLQIKAFASNQVEAALAAGKTTAAVDAHAVAIKKLKDEQTTANKAVSDAKSVLDAMKASSDGSKESLQLIARATEDYEQAQKKANVATKESKDHLKAAGDQAKTYSGIITDVNALLAKIPSNYTDYVESIANGGKNATALYKEVETAIDNVIKKSAGLSGEAARNASALVTQLEKLKAPLVAFADAAAFQKILDEVDHLDSKFGTFKTDTMATFMGILGDMEKIPGAVATNGGALIKWLQEAVAQDAALDKQQQTTQKTFDNAWNKYVQATQTQAIPITVTLHDRLKDLDQKFKDVNGVTFTELEAAIHGLGLTVSGVTDQETAALNGLHAVVTSGTTELPMLEQAWNKYGGAIDNLAQVNLPKAEQAWQEVIAKMIEAKAPMGDILEVQAKIAQAYIDT
jgi:tape measure domain-containing protein